MTTETLAHIEVVRKVYPDAVCIGFDSRDMPFEFTIRTSKLKENDTIIGAGFYRREIAWKNAFNKLQKDKKNALQL